MSKRVGKEQMEIKDECYGRFEKSREYYMMPHLMEMPNDEKNITTCNFEMVSVEMSHQSA
jgi:hypothetical protein